MSSPGLSKLFFSSSAALFANIDGVMVRFVIAGLFIVSVGVAAVDDDQDARYRSSLMVATVLEKIRQDYVDPNEVNYDKLTYSALEGMVLSLDPYCEFLDPRRYEEMRRDTEGEFGGLGIYIGVQNRTLVINMPIEGGPAFRAGVMPGDWIVKINGQSTKGLSVNAAIRFLRGKTGEPITLVLFRPAGNETKEVTLTREIISVPTVRGTRILTADEDLNKIGYTRITQFGDKTLDEFAQAVRTLSAKGMKALVLDLRNNPGGLLEAAVQVAGKFTPEGTLIVTTEGRAGAGKAFAHKARGREHWLDLPLVVLINRHSASGAEIVAGSLKDLRRAILIGETTYGKGSVQTVQPLDLNMSSPVALRLTTARYYTPSHNPINKVGIPPNLAMPVSPEQERAVLRKQNWHLLNEDERQKLAGVRDGQLERAVAV
ncbi:MAG: S41 family peptidase, partial [Verrucomicrobiales bacterium]|nr:S41 family peptidase [Verrucomicrobiales bacterium]